MCLAAEAPDLDIFGNFGGPAFGFGHHRGFTHSFLGAFLVSGLVVGFMYLIWRSGLVAGLKSLVRRVLGRKAQYNLQPQWGLLYALAYLACMSHILLDFTNNYGIRPLWPFSEKWYSWDIVFIVEPVLLVLLIGGLALPALFSLINEEVGARVKGPKGRAAAILALLGVCFTWGVRDYEHRRAVNALDARLYRDADPLRVSAFPAMLNPFQWYGVVETTNFFATMPVDSLVPEVDPQGQMDIRYKPEETPITIAAKKSYLGRFYFDWAQYPMTETDKLESGGYVVRFSDLRFEYFGRRGRNPLGAGVELNPDLRVVREFMGTRSRLVEDRPAKP